MLREGLKWRLMHAKKLIRKNDQAISNNLNDRVENAQKEQLPDHIAIIMDGNGRWAKKERYRESQVIMKECKQLRK